MADRPSIVPVVDPRLHRRRRSACGPGCRAIPAAHGQVGRIAATQASGEEGALLTPPTRPIRATNAVEVGMFTGYSAMCLARGLAPGGRLLCCDVSEE